MGTKALNRYFKKRRRAKLISNQKETIHRVEQMGKDWAAPAAASCPGVKWEVRGQNATVSYVVQDGFMHHQDRRNIRYSTPLAELV